MLDCGAALNLRKLKESSTQPTNTSCTKYGIPVCLALVISECQCLHYSSVSGAAEGKRLPQCCVPSNSVQSPTIPWSNCRARTKLVFCVWHMNTIWREKPLDNWMWYYNSGLLSYDGSFPGLPAALHKLVPRLHSWTGVVSVIVGKIWLLLGVRAWWPLTVDHQDEHLSWASQASHTAGKHPCSYVWPDTEYRIKFPLIDGGCFPVQHVKNVFPLIIKKWLLGVGRQSSGWGTCWTLVKTET